MREERRSQRIIACVPLEIQPVVPAHKAETAVINLHGALVVAPAQWAVGTVLKITNRRTNHEIVGHVTWIGPQDTAGHFKVGIEFDTAVTTFWGAAYDAEAEETS